MEQLQQYLDFLQDAEQLKSVTRTAWTSRGVTDTTAAHSWRLALLAMLLLPDYPQLDGVRVLSLCLVHDLGETYEGDISAALLPDQEQKHRQELEAMQRLSSLLPEEQGRRLSSLWSEYEEGQTPEARLVKALDKAETILQHNQGKNPPDFDYGFNLEYGRALFRENALLRQLRTLLDAQTRARMDADYSNGKE